MYDNQNISMKSACNTGEFRPVGAPVGEEWSGARVDRYLSSCFPFLSRAAWQKRLRDGQVLIEGSVAKPAQKVLEGEKVSMYHPRQSEPEVDDGIYPIWKEGRVMAVYKPGNLPMHESGPYRKNTFAYLVRERIGQNWAAVHRIDRETSGIVLCSDDPEIRKDLSSSLADRVLEKEYLAVVKGFSSKREWTELGPIGDATDSPIRIKKWVVEGGQSAETGFSVLGEKQGYSLLLARPRTGRTNQIRIHSAYAGLPLVGDILYDPDEETFLEWFDHGKTEAILNKVGFKRCLLHATRVKFIHPETNKLCHVHCPMPEDMSSFWDNLR